MSLVELVREIVSREMAKKRFVEVGVVTSVFPHRGDSDKENYECNVRIRDRDVELRRVPILTHYLGLSGPPHVGDVVAVAYMNGDENYPVVIGRLYSDEVRPPTSDVGEYVLSPGRDRLKKVVIMLSNQSTGMVFEEGRVRLSSNRGNRLALDSRRGVLRVGRKDVNVSVTIDNGGRAEIFLETSNAEGKVEISGDGVSISISGVGAGASVALKSSGDIEITSDYGGASKISLGSKGIKVSSDMNIEISTDKVLRLKASLIKIEGDLVDMKSNVSTRMESEGLSSLRGKTMVIIKGGMVHINPPG